MSVYSSVAHEPDSQPCTLHDRAAGGSRVTVRWASSAQWMCKRVTLAGTSNNSLHTFLEKCSSYSAYTAVYTVGFIRSDRILVRKERARLATSYKLELSFEASVGLHLDLRRVALQYSAVFFHISITENTACERSHTYCLSVSSSQPSRVDRARAMQRSCKATGVGVRWI